MSYQHKYFQSIPFSFTKNCNSSNISLEKDDNNEWIDIKQLCLKHDIAYRYTGRNPVGYYQNKKTFDNISLRSNNKNTDIRSYYYIAGTKHLQGLPQPYYDLKLLEIFAFSFKDYVIRECVCILDLFKENDMADKELQDEFCLKDNPVYFVYI